MSKRKRYKPSVAVLARRKAQSEQIKLRGKQVREIRKKMESIDK